MLCKQGIWVENQGMHVPCGQCMPCRINKGRLWSARILMEQAWNPNYSLFFTFTFEDVNLHITHGDDGAPVSTLNKKHFLTWINNVQRITGKFRYYAIGEYGDYSFRPHYHMAVFPLKHTKTHLIGDLWSLGFHTVSELNHERARYLANYTTKKLTKDTDERLQRNQEPEFRTSSRSPPLASACVDILHAHYTRSPNAIALLKVRGDVERLIRFDNKIYPIGQWPLARLRKKLGIPALHRDRIKANPNYLEFHQQQEAECDPTAHDQQEKHLATQKRITHYRGQSQKI